ncbi:ATP-binding cassette domain-containing protein [Paenibacillaceae bacterium WGS1546]|uniref:ABC transporter ATP-binding protein n=1 Tax=Cohnella sp. WGS1546 TaxID=3366810 RepID=UPI00372D0F15
MKNNGREAADLSAVFCLTTEGFFDSILTDQDGQYTFKEGESAMGSRETEESIIRIRNLHKSYKKMDVLKGVNIDIKKGSIFCLLGSNGAGKTTMVKILTTLLKADRGEALLCGHDVSKQPDKVRGVISLTGQYAAVDGLLTARENIRMIGKLYHVENAASKADELLERFNLTHVADRPVSTYSGGMRRRLDIAMSLIGRPEIIFLDEPTTGLDPQSRIKMWKVIRNLLKSGVTVFLTTQYIDEADQLADHIAVLHKGTIIAEGTAKELKSTLAGGTILLGFSNEESYQLALTKLDGFQYTDQADSLTLSVTTDGSVKQLAKLLADLEDTDIALLEQKQASLEDVFLTLVTES